MSREHRCEMTLCGPSEAQHDYVPCRKPATHEADTDCQTIHLCERHARQWNSDHDDERYLAREVTS